MGSQKQKQVRRNYSDDQKKAFVDEAIATGKLTDTARKHGINVNVLSRWKSEFYGSTPEDKADCRFITSDVEAESLRKSLTQIERLEKLHNGLVDSLTRDIVQKTSSYKAAITNTSLVNSLDKLLQLKTSVHSQLYRVQKPSDNKSEKEWELERGAQQIVEIMVQEFVKGRIIRSVGNREKLEGSKEPDIKPPLIIPASVLEDIASDTSLI
ncbi:MAG: transposase [Candidatus Obscuribacterales bacterium]|nr:transposase [Candidatus Obscuribacterales bacterium]